MQNCCFGQTGLNLDSLTRQLDSQPDDTLKLKILYELSRGYMQNDPSLALSYSNKLLLLSEKLNNLPGLIDALSIKGRIYITSGQYDSAKIYCDKSIQLSDSTKDIKRLAEGYSNYGYLLYRTKGSSPGYEYYLKSYNLFKEIADSIGIANSLNGIGVMLMKQSKYDSAIYYYLQLIRIGEKLKIDELLGKGFINLGLAYDELKDYQRASYYFKESIKINEKLNNLIFVSTACDNLGNIMYNKHEYDSAWNFYSKASELCKRTNHQLGLVNAQIGLGNVLLETGEYDKAYQFYEEAKKSYSSLGNTEGYLIAYKNQGLINEKRGNYEASIQIYDSCLLIAEKYNLNERRVELLFNIYNSYWLKKDFENAFKYLLDYQLLRDSIMSVEKAELIANLQLKYEKEKDSVHILSLENEKLVMKDTIRQRTIQRNRYVYAGSGTILVFIFVFAYYRQRTHKNRIISEQRIIQLEEEKKLWAARAIVEGQEEERKRIARELHDGLGVLLSTAKMQFTTLRDNSPQNRSMIDKATKLLEQASGDVRRISHNMMPGLLTKFGFFEAVEDLIEQIDESEGIHAVTEIHGEHKRLTENTEIMLYRIVQEMVNNTLKYAEAKNIVLDIDVTTDKMKFSYSDDGKGFDLNEKLKSKSIGLTSIQSRVKFLGGELEMETSIGAGVRYTFQILC